MSVCVCVFYGICRCCVLPSTWPLTANVFLFLFTWLSMFDSNPHEKNVFLNSPQASEASTVYVSIIKHDVIVVLAMHTLLLIFLDDSYMFKVVFHRGPGSKPHSPIQNSKATEMSKFPCCHRQRQTDTGWIWGGTCLKCIPPEKDGPFISFFTSYRYHQSEEKPVIREQYTNWITTPQVDSPCLHWRPEIEKRIAKICIVSSRLKSERKNKHANNWVSVQ